MKDFNFTVKVSDLLRSPGSKDTVYFSNKFSTHIPMLIDTGITSTIHLQWLNKEEIMVVCEHTRCEILVECDKCWTQFTKVLEAPSTTSKVSMRTRTSPEQEEDISIDPKTETIDMEQYITNTLLLSLAVVNLCTQCEQHQVWDDEQIESWNAIVRKY